MRRSNDSATQKFFTVIEFAKPMHAAKQIREKASQAGMEGAAPSAPFIMGRDPAFAERYAAADGARPSELL